MEKIKKMVICQLTGVNLRSKIKKYASFFYVQTVYLIQLGSCGKKPKEENGFAGKPKYELEVTQTN